MKTALLPLSEATYVRHRVHSSDRVWNAMDKLKDANLTEMLGVAPGPANGFTLDLILCFERFGPLLVSMDDR